MIERARFALKRVGTAQRAAEAEVRRLEQEVWRQEKEAPQVRAEAGAALHSNRTS